jgi:hypothetical protein
MRYRKFVAMRVINIADLTLTEQRPLAGCLERLSPSDYRRPYRTYRDAFDAAAHCSSSQLHGVLNNTP